MKKLIVTAVGAIATLILAGCATATPGVAQSDLARRIGQAQTPADHEDLAAYFEERAAGEERGARECKKLRQRFDASLSSLARLSDDTRGLLEHYDSLLEGHRRNAEDYRALAAWHRRAAQRAAGSGVEQ